MLLASWLVLVGCGGADPIPTSTGATGDTGAPAAACAEEVAVTYAEGGCLGYADQWEFKVDVMGCADGATLAIWDTTALDADEEHPMALGSAAPDGAWQNWVLGPLPHATPPAEWSAGENTTFDCVADLATLTTAVRLTDAAGATLACAIWGHDPDAVLSGAATGAHADPADYAGCEIRPF